MEKRLTDVQHLSNIIVLMDQYMTKWTKYTLEEVDKDQLLIFGFVKYLELIGQEASAMTDAFKGKHYAPWTQLESYKDVFDWEIGAEELHAIDFDPSFSEAWRMLLDIFKEVK